MFEDKNWKIELKYGKIKTDFTHFTVIADGVVGQLTNGFSCQEGRAWMSMKVWSVDSEQAMDMIKVIGKNIGFNVDGRVYVYDTPPDSPPKEAVFGYDIKFRPYEGKRESDA